jgi:outer membrane protein assembly factor BamB
VAGLAFQEVVEPVPESTTGTSMYGLDATTGAILWSYNRGGSVTGGAAIVAGSLY